MKLQDISSNENLILFSGVMSRFVDFIMKVDIPKKLMLYFTVILSWVNNRVVNNYIYESSFIGVITSLCTDDQTYWIENIKKIYCGEYTNNNQC